MSVAEYLEDGGDYYDIYGTDCVNGCGNCDCMDGELRDEEV